jgi:hypothetical protein
MGEEELTVFVGRDYMPVRGDDGIIEMRSRAGMPASAAAMAWPMEFTQVDFNGLLREVQEIGGTLLEARLELE